MLKTSQLPLDRTSNPWEFKPEKINAFNKEIMVDDTDGDFTLNQKKI